MSDSVRQLDVADIRVVLGALPHRYPMLLVDRIIEIKGCDSCIGIKNVTMNEPHFDGHFPGEPIMPGVLIVEGMAQTAGAMFSLYEQSRGYGESRVYFLGIDKARFRKPVVPGDSLRYCVRTLQRKGDVCRFFSEAKVDGTRVAEAEFSAMVTPRRIGS